MTLTQEEKDILTLMDRTPVDQFIKNVQIYVMIDAKVIRSAIEKLIAEKYVFTMTVTKDGQAVTIYLHNKDKVTPDLINETLLQKKKSLV